ncbi:nitroreductase [Thauera sp. WH-1]|uniref:nitroreductase n=1 Tax=Thauera sp. WH-1 TaxID=3398230 RepID=UPI0039FBD1A6
MNDAALMSVTEAVDHVMSKRRSVRAFLPERVADGTIDAILRVAARAPSGTNTQPWRVHVLTGATLGRLVDAVCAAFDAADGSHKPEYDYYPPEFFEPYLGRRRKVGWDLYSRLGIAKGDGARMKAQHRRNFEFFGAPVGLIFTIDRRLGKGSWLDYGMFLQNVMLAAEARGLATCPQAAWIDYHRIIGEQLQLPPNEQVVCGIALGYADPDAPENALVSERAELAEFVVRHP